MEKLNLFSNEDLFNFPSKFLLSKTFTYLMTHAYPAQNKALGIVW